MIDLATELLNFLKFDESVFEFNFLTKKKSLIFSYCVLFHLLSMADCV